MKEEAGVVLCEGTVRASRAWSVGCGGSGQWAAPEARGGGGLDCIR